MRAIITLTTLDTIYEYNLPKYDDETSNGPTLIRFNPQVAAIFLEDTTRTDPINETNPDSPITTFFGWF